MSDRLEVMLTDPVATAFEKNVQGTSATEANNGYGTPSVSKSAAVLARIVNAPSSSTGVSTAQAMPTLVCL